MPKKSKYATSSAFWHKRTSKDPYNASKLLREERMGLQLMRVLLLPRQEREGRNGENEVPMTLG